MRRKRKDSSYLNKLVNKFRRIKTEPNSPKNKNGKTDLRAKPIFSDTSRFKKNEQALQRSRQEFILGSGSLILIICYNDNDRELI
ncbi:unnamed protein product [marine sediment metagenome]|uniref:Uncharacterized protein n=1 Tax=marine sediment metagenome TaxID=412755 RepID=X1F977_9ZZZZ